MTSHLAVSDTLTARIRDRHERRALVRRLPSRTARRRIRERAGVSQEDIANELGVTRETVCRWETTDRVPNDDVLERYVMLLDHLESVVAEEQPA